MKRHIPKPTPLQRRIAGILLVHYKHLPDGLGLTAVEIADPLGATPAAVRTALQPMARTLRDNGFALKLICEEDSLLRQVRHRWRFAPRGEEVSRPALIALATPVAV